jgi:proteasome lid subunit RPN8/RPN11
MRIARSLYDELVAHAVEELPNECCGLVASKEGVAQRVYRVKNSYKYPRAGYEMGVDAAGLMSDIDDAGWQIGAMYHSHPRTAAEPSQTDINLALIPETKQPLWPDTLYIIIGFPDGSQEPEVRGWRIDSVGVAEVALSVG